MALTITLKEGQSFIEKCGLNFKIVTGSVAFDSSYPTGGESMDLSKQFPTNLHVVLFEAKDGYLFEYDYTNKKVIARYFDYNGTADGPAIQIPNTTDLSALTDVRFVAIGK